MVGFLALYACSPALLWARQQRSAGDVLSFQRLWRKRDGSVEEGTDFAANGTFASLLYSTYTEADCKRWAARYTPEGEAASAAPFCKLGSDGDGAKARRQRPRLTGFKQIAGPSEGERVRAFTPCFAGNGQACSKPSGKPLDTT